MSKKKDSKKKHHKSKDKKKKKQQQQKKAQPSVRDPRHRLIRWGIVAILSLIVVVLSIYWIPGDVQYKVTETYVFSGQETGSVHLSVLLPVTGYYQEVIGLEVTWPGSWELHSDGRLNIVRFETDVQAGDTVEAVIEYQVNLWQGHTRWVEDNPEISNLGRPDVIQPDDLDLIAWTEELNVEGNDLLIARQIFDDAKQSLNEPTERHDPAGVVSSIEGANLLTAMYHAVDMPARTVTGLMMPVTIPFIPVRASWNHPAEAHAWVEIFVEDAWLMADPNSANPFYQRDLFGWTDGKHLVYEEITAEAALFQSLINEAEDNGTWMAEMSAPLRFVAWSQMQSEDIELTPMVTLRKIWDARLVMIFSVVLILVVLNWLYEGDQRRWQKISKDE